MARIRFEDKEKNIHTIDNESGFYLQERLIYGDESDYPDFAVIKPDKKEIIVTKDVFYKLKDKGLTEKQGSNICFESLDDCINVLLPNVDYALREDPILSDGEDYRKFYIFRKDKTGEIEISERVFECLKDNGISVGYN